MAAAVARPLVSIQTLESDMATDGPDTTNSLPLPDVMKAPIRPDLVNSVHALMRNNSVHDLNGSKVLTNESEVSEIEKEAWKLLRGAIVDYCGNPVGTVAASDPAEKIPLNYDQVFIRDFVPSALAFLLNGEGEIVKNFLLNTLQL